MEAFVSVCGAYPSLDVYSDGRKGSCPHYPFPVSDGGMYFGSHAFCGNAGDDTRKKYGLFGGICGAALLVLSAAVLKDTLPGLWAEQQLRAEVNEPYRELFAVLSDEKNKDNFYLIDVYSSVAYSEKMFEDVDNSQDNYDIMGGWACKSPLQKKKLSAFGITDMEKALKDRKDVFFVRKKSEDMQWLYDYYEGHGTPVKTALLDTVAEEFEIYEVCAVN